jgi:hypothetical protein
VIGVDETGNYQVETLFDGSADINPRTISESPGGRGGICHSNDGRVIARAVEHEGEGRLAILLCDSQNLAVTQRWKAHDQEIDSLVYDASGSYLASRSHEQLKIWNADDQKLVTSATIPDRFLALTDLVGLEDGFAAVYSHVPTGREGVYKVTPTDTEFVTVSRLGDVGKPICSAAISHDATIIAALCYHDREQAEIWIYDVESGNPRFRLPGRTAAARGDMVLAPDGSHLAAFFPDDDAISVWDLKTKQKVATLSNFSYSVVGMFLADDGTFLVSDWRELTVWDLTRTGPER